jgi:hypothetical protein
MTAEDSKEKVADLKGKVKKAATPSELSVDAATELMIERSREMGVETIFA